MRLVRVPLRVSLVGGGSDLPSHYETHGGAVVSFTIDKYIYITAKPNLSLFPHRYRLVYSKVEECNERSEIKHPIIRELVDDYAIGALDLDVMSDIPAGTGMGSSSAFTVGLHAALLNGRLGKHWLADQACITEIEELKEPIGKQDAYAAAFGGLNYFEFSKDRVTVNPIPLNIWETTSFKDHMTLIYVGGQRSASEQLKEQATKDNSTALRLMADMARATYHCLQKGEIHLVGELIRSAWELKKSLSDNVTTERIDNIINTGILNGATAGKLLGAGGAGFVLLFCPPDNKLKMLSGLKDLNVTYIPFNMDFEGVKVLYENGT